LSKNGKLKKASWNSRKIQINEDVKNLSINKSQSPPKKQLLDQEEQKKHESIGR